MLLDDAWADIPLDLVVYCRGGAAFDYFLRSDSSRMNFIRAVFDPQTGLINQLHSGRRAAGLHFYLPDFSFREKRAFMQFVSTKALTNCICFLSGNSLMWKTAAMMIYSYWLMLNIPVIIGGYIFCRMWFCFWF